MRRLKLIKVVVPEIVAYMEMNGEKIPDYSCPECGFGIADNYVSCPYCSSELDWNRVTTPEQKFIDLVRK